jgi:hypothetical protein
MDEIDWTIFDEFSDHDENDSNNDNVCCGQDRVYIEKDGILVCQQCGTFINSSIYVLEKFTASTLRTKYKSIYKPINHMLHKIREINGLIIPDISIEWRKYFIKVKIKNIHDIRKVLRKNNKTCYNKYTYYFYNQLTDKSMFKIDHSMIKILMKRFVCILGKFQKVEVKERKNMPNYHFILSMLLKEQKIQIRNKLFVPKLPQTKIKNTIIWNKIINA